MWFSPNCVNSVVNEKLKTISCPHWIVPHGGRFSLRAFNWHGVRIDYVGSILRYLHYYTVCVGVMVAHFGPIKHVNQSRRDQKRHMRREKICENLAASNIVDVLEASTRLLLFRRWAMASRPKLKRSREIRVKIGMKHFASPNSVCCLLVSHTSSSSSFPEIPMWAISSLKRELNFGDCAKNLFVSFFFISPWEGLFVASVHRCAVTSVSFYHYCEMHKQPSRLSILSSRGCCEENSPFHYSMLHASTQTRSPLFIVSPLSFNMSIFIVTKTTSYRRHWKLSSFSLQQNVVRCGCLKRKREKIAHFEARKVKRKEKINKKSFYFLKKCSFEWIDRRLGGIGNERDII